MTAFPLKVELDFYRGKTFLSLSEMLCFNMKCNVSKN